MMVLYLGLSVHLYSSISIHRIWVIFWDKVGSICVAVFLIDDSNVLSDRITRNFPTQNAREKTMSYVVGSFSANQLKNKK